MSGLLFREAYGGAFQVVELSPSQKADVSTWPPSTVKTIIADLNLDGADDIFLADVSSVPSLSSVTNQMVFSSMTANSRPIHATRVTGDVKAFFTESYAWAEDTEYFFDAAPIVQQNQPASNVAFVPEYCATPAYAAIYPLELEPGGGPITVTWYEDIEEHNIEFVAECYLAGRTVFHYDYVLFLYTIPAGMRDYSVFNQTALALGNVLSKVSDLETGMEAGSIEAIEVEGILEEMLGVEVFGGVLSEGGTLEREEEIDPEDLDETRFWDILSGIFRGQVAVDRNEETPERTCTQYQWGPQVINQATHYARNDEYPSPIPFFLDVQIPTQYFDGPDISPAHNIRNDANDNVEYRGNVDGPYEHWQLVYDASGIIVNDPINLGTWDFISPSISNPTSFLGHVHVDVIPWIEWGNFPSSIDTSTRQERIDSLPDYIAGPISLLQGCQGGYE